MYFPYLRGRQAELLALRELNKRDLISDKIIPIIEPTKFNSTLFKTLDSYLKNEKSIAVIMNPQVGEVCNVNDNCEHWDSIKNSPIIKTYLVNSNLKNQLSYDLDLSKILIINTKRDDKDLFFEFFNENYPLYTFIPDDRHFKKSISSDKILLGDKFNKSRRNADYLNNDDEFFSDDHLYFIDENFKGFSDFSIVGQEFNDSGFAPYAIAIHIVYLDNNSNFRIKHFVSESNEDISNPAGKFKEALTKFMDWVNIEKNKPGFYMTFALKELINCYNLGQYPGLSTLKKLCIMNHLELAGHFLDTNQ